MSTDLTVALREGFHFDVSAKLYHSDPCAVPSLSASIAKVMIEESPASAKLQHPRLTPQPAPGVPDRTMQIGSIAHKLILGRGADVEIIDSDAYRTNASKEARDAAHAAGRLPILAPDYEQAKAISTAFYDQIGLIPRCEGWHDARAEVVAIAQDPATGTVMRSMFDRIEMHEDHAVIWDLKTGDQSAAPWEVGRRIANMSYDIAAGFYTRVVELIRPSLEGRVFFRWAFIENAEPYGMTVCEADATTMEIGRRKTLRACADWARCLESGVWPRYPARIITPEYPGWAASRWMEREDAETEYRRVGARYRPTELAGPC